jgi:hypothetical protein
MSGGVFKRCGCRYPGSGRSLDSACPRLSERGHGSWYFDCPVASVRGRRERVCRDGHLTRRDAVAARDALLNRSDEDRGVDAWTVGRWLRYWLSTQTSIRPSTLRSYTEHVELHLIPHLGRIRLGELTGHQVADMFHTLGSTNNRYGRPPTPATLHRIRATLRSALGAAIRDGLLRDNPAHHIELPSPRRPHAQVWDRPPRQRLARTRRPIPGRGVDSPATGHVLRVRRRRPPVGAVVADHAARATPRRSMRAALGRRRPRHPGHRDRPAAHRLRPHRRGRPTQDRPQPPGHRPRQGHRPAAAHPPTPPTRRTPRRRRSGCCASTAAGNRPSGTSLRSGGGTPAACSPPRMVHRWTRTGSPAGSGA